MNLQEFKDEYSRYCYGMTKEEAHRDGVCIHCQLDWEPRTYSSAGRREYKISGLCEQCWDELVGEL